MTAPTADSADEVPGADMRALFEGIDALVRDHMDRIQTLRFEVEWKPDGSPVTKADILVEDAVGAFLKDKLGSVAFIAEESYRTESGDREGWTAVLDPIDGTENFTSGLPEWGLSLSVWHGGMHQASLLLLPELGVRLMTGDRVEVLASRLTGFSSSISPALVEQLATAGEVRLSGCAVYNMWCVITGRFRRFVNPVGAYSWDLQAGVMLALEHGCEVQIDGQPYDGRYLAPGRRYRVDVLNRHTGHSR